MNTGYKINKIRESVQISEQRVAKQEVPLGSALRAVGDVRFEAEIYLKEIQRISMELEATDNNAPGWESDEDFSARMNGKREGKMKVVGYMQDLIAGLESDLIPALEEVIEQYSR